MKRIIGRTTEIIKSGDTGTLVVTHSMPWQGEPYHGDVLLVGNRFSPVDCGKNVMVIESRFGWEIIAAEC